jgi:hypothetical protein
MRHQHSAAGADLALGRVLTVAVALVGALFALLVAASYPVAAGGVLSSVAVGVVAGRVRTRVESLATPTGSPDTPVEGPVDPA